MREGLAFFQGVRSTSESPRHPEYFVCCCGRCGLITLRQARWQVAHSQPPPLPGGDAGQGGGLHAFRADRQHHHPLPQGAMPLFFGCLHPSSSSSSLFLFLFFLFPSFRRPRQKTSTLAAIYETKHFFLPSALNVKLASLHAPLHLLSLKGRATGDGERQALLRVLRVRHHRGRPAEALAGGGQRVSQPLRDDGVRPRHEGAVRCNTLSFFVGLVSSYRAQ